MLIARNITKYYGERTILRNISFDITQQDRIGLVGQNGAGKTTLANILYGNMEADEGTITIRQQLKIGYLKQSVDSIIDTNQPITGEFLEKTSELGLIKVHSWEKDRLSHLSGGEKLKMALAEIWAMKPDVLILDEPTNHLDFKGITWLTEQLRIFKGAVIVISHDRYFLDKTVSKIFDLEEGQLTCYEGNYTSYYEKKKKKRDDQFHHYRVQQNEKVRIEGQMGQLQQWANKAHRTMREQEGMKEYHGVKAKKLDKAIKSKMKRLSKELEKNKIEKPLQENKVQFKFEANKKRGKRMLEVQNLSKNYSSKNLFHNSSFYLNKGERVGLVGPNGCGKTTLLRIILGDESVTSGELSKSPALKVAYLSQDVADMPLSSTSIEALNLVGNEQILKARTLLANMGIAANKLDQPIYTLSLGERTRVKLAAILLKEYDLLILDEPTNHLDLVSRTQLEKTLAEFSGTILVVSHDFYFLNTVCEKLLVFEEKKINRIEMTVEEYERRKLHTQNNIGKQQVEEELLRVNTEITAILGELSLLTPESEKYRELDGTFQNLMKRKRELMFS